MVCRFKARIPTRRGRRTRAGGGFHAYDNLGKAADGCKAGWKCAQETNALNQYTALGEFVPEFDADGKAADGCKADWTHAQRAPRWGEGAMGRARINQTKVQTSTGIWNMTYNAENRPTVFSRENEDGTTTQVTCAYDYMGRRATKKVETITTNTETAESTATTTLHQRYLYRGYLQIACCDLTRENHPHLWLITWDPTQPVATRPLSIRKDGTWYCYGWDLTKNVCEVFSNEGRINNTVIYSYTPYGSVSAEGSVQQPIQWSSEFYDEELGLVYYNYRHYNPLVGRWGGRDASPEQEWMNLYTYVGNFCAIKTDTLGLCFGFSSSDFAGSIHDYMVQNAPYKLAAHLPKCPKGSRIRSGYPVTVNYGFGSGSVKIAFEYRTKKTKAGYVAKANGCGPEGGIKAPDSPLCLADFTEACNKHDLCYGQCGSNKSACDDRFLYDMIGACASSGSISACVNVAYIYYTAVALGGESAFQSAQDESCEWLPCNQ